MTTILTPTEAANVLRTVDSDPVMLDLLPIVDAYIVNATGRAWQDDSPIDITAKAAARILLVMWFENPAMIDTAPSESFGLRGVLTQLYARALLLKSSGVPSSELKIVGFAPGAGAVNVSINAAMVVIFNHEMGSGAESAAVLKDGAGGVISTVNTFDVTRTILTVTPGAALTAGVIHALELTSIPDIYGASITDSLGFST